jgi:hypothetical protein
MSTQQAESVPHEERLFRKGMKYFYDPGFHGTTVDAILEVSGVSKGSFVTNPGPKRNLREPYWPDRISPRPIGSAGTPTNSWSSPLGPATAGPASQASPHRGHRRLRFVLCIATRDECVGSGPIDQHLLVAHPWASAPAAVRGGRERGWERAP